MYFRRRIIMEEEKKVAKKVKKVVKEEKKYTLSLYNCLAIVGVALGIIALTLSIVDIVKLTNNNKKLSERVQKLEVDYKKMHDDIYGEEIEYDVSMFDEIVTSDLKNITEKRIVMIGRNTCGWCARFAPILAQAEKDFNIDIMYLDLLKMTSDDEAALKVTKRLKTFTLDDIVMFCEIDEKSARWN